MGCSRDRSWVMSSAKALGGAYVSCTSSARTVIVGDPLGVHENSRRKWPVFDSGALYIVRTEVLALAGQAGLPDDRAGMWSWPFTSWRPMWSAMAAGRGDCGSGIWQGHCTARSTTAT